jgi:hypothetical protein
MGPVESEPFDPMFYTSSMRPQYRKDIDLIKKESQKNGCKIDTPLKGQIL